MSEYRPPADPGSAPGPAVVVGVSQGSAAPDDSVFRGMPKIAVVLADPRLAEVRERDQARDWSGAARILDTIRAANPGS